MAILLEHEKELEKIKESSKKDTKKSKDDEGEG
jgi:hypothetical protein